MDTVATAVHSRLKNGQSTLPVCRSRCVAHGLLNRTKLSMRRKALAPARAGDYSETTSPMRTAICSSSSCCWRWPPRRSRRTRGRREEAGRVRHHRRAEGAVARSDLPLGARHPDRSQLRGGALNNLAIAYEHEGDLAKARGAYEKALELEPNNALIKQNYELFKEINDRTTRKDSSVAWRRVALTAGVHATTTRFRSRRRSGRSWTCRRFSACSSPASSPAAPKTSTATSRPRACCAASCAPSRACASSTPTSLPLHGSRHRRAGRRATTPRTPRGRRSRTRRTSSLLRTCSPTSSTGRRSARNTSSR